MEVGRVTHNDEGVWVGFCTREERTVALENVRLWFDFGLLIGECTICGSTLHATWVPHKEKQSIERDSALTGD
jgi:hypothetical protein